MSFSPCVADTPVLGGENCDSRESHVKETTTIAAVEGDVVESETEEASDGDETTVVPNDTTASIQFDDTDDIDYGSEAAEGTEFPSTDSPSTDDDLTVAPFIGTISTDVPSVETATTYITQETTNCFVLR